MQLNLIRRGIDRRNWRNFYVSQNSRNLSHDARASDWVTFAPRRFAPRQMLQDICPNRTIAPSDLDICPKDRRLRKSKIYDRFLIQILQNVSITDTKGEIQPNIYATYLWTLPMWSVNLYGLCSFSLSYYGFFEISNKKVDLQFALCM